MKKIIRLIAVVAAVACAASALAVTAEEAKQLGGPVLTPWGAEKAGNREGTIPQYNGAGVKAPPGWDPKNPGVRPDPYEKKPLFSITANNMAQYADKLNGMMEVFKRYPNFRMDIYPSHRAFVVPKYVQENTVRNATACKAVNNESRLEGCYAGWPFPIPKTGNEEMWNHLASYEGPPSANISEAYLVPVSGSPILNAKSILYQDVPFYDPPTTSPRPTNTAIWRFYLKETEPARMAGQQLLFLDSLDAVGQGRRAWQYLPGQRRVKLAPDLAYDTPNPNAGGESTMDDFRGFIGALDRFDFKLIGKKEKYIWYNSFTTVDNNTCPAQKFLTRNFPNPDCVRWELHRVWVVEAKLKPGLRHIYHKRIFYWDEDTHLAGNVENYDAAGKLYRVTNLQFYPYFEAEGGTGSNPNEIDLQTGAWVGVGACPDCGWWPHKAEETRFSPEAMAGAGVR